MQQCLVLLESDRRRTRSVGIVINCQRGTRRLHRKCKGWTLCRVWLFVTERVEKREGGFDADEAGFDACVEKDFNPSVNRGITAHRWLDSPHPFIFPPQLPLTPTSGHGMEASERSEELPSPAHSPHAVFMVHYHSESWPISFWLSASVVSPN